MNGNERSRAVLIRDGNRPNIGGSPRCATSINNGVRTPFKVLIAWTLPTPGKSQLTHAHTLRTHTEASDGRP